MSTPKALEAPAVDMSAETLLSYAEIADRIAELLKGELYEYAYAHDCEEIAKRLRTLASQPAEPEGMETNANLRALAETSDGWRTWAFRLSDEVKAERARAKKAEAELVALKQPKKQAPWTDRLAHIEQRTAIERQASDLKVAIEHLGGHPLLTDALNAADEAMRILGQWHDEGEPGGNPVAVKHSAERAAVEEERAAIEAEARRYAGYYAEGSDGRNTFLMLANWIAGRAALKQPVGDGEVEKACAVLEAVGSWPEPSPIDLLRRQARQIEDMRGGEPIGQDERSRLKARIRALEAERAAQTPAARDVLAERKRQVEVEGWTPKHDDLHVAGDLAYAAAAYANRSASDDYTGDLSDEDVPALWPWTYEWWKPKSRRLDLVKAGALILAEIERLDRAALSADQVGASS